MASVLPSRHSSCMQFSVPSRIECRQVTPCRAFAGFGDKSWDKSPGPDEKTISSPFSSPGAVFSSLSYCPGPPRFPDYETRRASAAGKGPTMRRETVPKEGIMEKSITRRSFLAGSAAVSSIAALGLAGCASSQKTATPTAATGTEGIITPSYPPMRAPSTSQRMT